MSDEYGIQIPALFRNYLVEAGIPYKQAEEISVRFNEQLEEVNWLSTDTGVTFTKSFDPRKE